MLLKIDYSHVSQEDIASFSEDFQSLVQSIDDLSPTKVWGLYFSLRQFTKLLKDAHSRLLHSE